MPTALWISFIPFTRRLIYTLDSAESVIPRLANTIDILYPLIASARSPRLLRQAFLGMTKQ